MAGDYRGKAGFDQLMGKVISITGGQFQEVVVDVLANDKHALVLATHHVTRKGARRTYNTAHIYRLANGKMAEGWERPESQAAFDEAWGKALPR